MVNKGGRRMRPSWLLLSLLLGLASGSLLGVPAAAGAPQEPSLELVSNGGFEERGDGALPPGWQIFAGEPGHQLRFDRGTPRQRGAVFTIVDDSRRQGYGLRSTPVPAEPGLTYQASAWARAEEGGRAYLYLDFWNNEKKRVLHQTASTDRSEWQRLSVSLQAPPEAAWVSVILYSTSTDMGLAQFDDVSLRPLRFADLTAELKSGDDQLDFRPADGSVVTTNPPSFVWLPVPGASHYTLEYSTDPHFPPAETIRIGNLDISVYTPSAPLDADRTWYWRVYAVNQRGESSAPARTRAFRISPSAALFALPPLEEVRQRIPRAHPRLFVTPDSLAAFRQKKDSELLYRLLWQRISSQAAVLAVADLPPEPPHARPGGVWDVGLWRQYSLAVKATDDLETLAFAYLLTGDRRLGEAARRWMLHIASWDPKGATSAAVNDEASMPILLKLSRAYTWAYDILTPEDRKVIQNVMRVRGNEAYRLLKERPFESRPYASHAGRSLGFLGEAAIAFLGDFPEAQEWLDYVIRIFYAVYPAWGGDSGGWAEGHAYWTSYMNRVLWFVDALQVATRLSLYDKPFFRNTGTFKLYTQPPYSKMGPFGDFADEPPNQTSANVMAHLARVYGNPYYQWYAEQLGTVVEMGVMGYIRAVLHPPKGLRGQAPVDLPSSAYFPDVGWVVFHKQLGRRDDAIQFMFKSSPYGSYSHSLADQNTFTLEAYGMPLAISSGYRPWYGSNHHMGWTKTTQAHNGILVNGQGQTVQSLAAKGRISGFLHGESFDYTAGDASRAYGQLLPRYLRHVVYVRPDLFVLFDDLKAAKPSTYGWLLHAYYPFAIDPQAGHLHLDAKSAQLDVWLWSSQPLTFSQTNQFAVPLDEPLNKPEQWHLNATTREAAGQAYFLAVLAPGKGQSRREVTLQRPPVTGGQGIRLTDATSTTLLLFRSQQETSPAQPAGMQADGLWVDGMVGGWLIRSDAPATQLTESSDASPEARHLGLLLVSGRGLRSASGYGLTATQPVDAELTISIRPHQAVELRGTLVTPAGPGSEPVEVVLQLPGLSEVATVTSSAPLLDWRLEGGRLHLLLAPGTHQVRVIAQPVSSL